MSMMSGYVRISDGLLILIGCCDFDSVNLFDFAAVRLTTSLGLVIDQPTPIKQAFREPASGNQNCEALILGRSSLGEKSLYAQLKHI